MRISRRGAIPVLSALAASVIAVLFFNFNRIIVMASDSKSKQGVNGGNRLSGESSPYLLQHADNPVDWYPWGEEAFEKARRENKPIFLSIGYSTCHWCHVMEEESFENEETAALMNETFVNIKVDREERPDIDNIYMTVCRMMTGGGGWPLTIIMTSDKKPFFAGTYIPRENRFGQMGMMDLIPRVEEVWSGKREELLKTAERVSEAINNAGNSLPGANPDVSVFKKAFDQFSGSYDSENGGFGSAPKFPTAHNFLFLLRYWKRSGNTRALEMVEGTLRGMKNGGIYDQVGYGFHRYSTDARWMVPHFEKMLYDQALISMAFIETFQATGKSEYSEAVRDIFTYVLRDMTDRSGGFYSAEDADSEGEEGKFYFWKEREIREILGPEESEFIIRYYNVSPEGNFKDQSTGLMTGDNILRLSKSWADISSEEDLSEAEAKAKSTRILEKLFSARQKRIHPRKDDKILTDWNGLMIASLAYGGRALDAPEYIIAARKAADFILEKMRDESGGLLHRYRRGEAGINGNIDDYAFFVWGLIELYQATYETLYLQVALDLTEHMVAHFSDVKGGGFYFTSDDGEKLLVRQKESYDGATPSGNSTAAYNLIRLGRLTGRADLEEESSAITRAFSADIERAPAGFTMTLCALDFGIGPSYEIVIAGDRESADTIEMLRALNMKYLPNSISLLRDKINSEEIAKIASYAKDQKSIGGRATVYICRNNACELPTMDIRGMLAKIE